ncbi:hypothetical protein EOD73_11300 [Inhella crocodyli]|uniref:Uncharacterized protein n=1 Tax=Inhella crocodyli TaxID=2499851 RepID=A0A437LH82_9BURK|nr:hypothetical protein EOD73_11300 [Inhella crocodyli]
MARQPLEEQHAPGLPRQGGDGGPACARGRTRRHRSRQGRGGDAHRGRSSRGAGLALTRPRLRRC